MTVTTDQIKAKLTAYLPERKTLTLTAMPTEGRVSTVFTLGGASFAVVLTQDAETEKWKRAVVCDTTQQAWAF